MDKTVPPTEFNVPFDVQSLEAGAAVESSVQTESSQGYATGLMDELFDEVDGLLDGSLVPPSEPLPIAPPPQPRQPINLDFATFLSQPPANLSSVAASMAAGETPMLTIPEDQPIELPQSSAEQARYQARQSSYGLFEKLLIFVGCSSAVAAVMIVLGSQGIFSRVGDAIAQKVQPTTASAPINPRDAKFAEYMGKTLESIDAKQGLAAPRQIPPLALSAPGTAQLPTVKVSGTGKATSNIVVGGLPRPIAPDSKVPTSGIAANQPPAAPAQPTAQNDLNQVVNKLAGLVDRLANGGTRVAAPVASVAAPGMGNAAMRTSTTAMPTAPVAAPQRTLKAVVDFGAQSTVIFEMNGVSQRYEKGESIGTSGWVFVKIENGNAVVRRNGEVRVLAAGQKL